MQFGVRCHDYPMREPETLFAAIHADGGETCQLALKKALAEDARDIPRIRAALRTSEVSVGVLGNYVEIGLAEEAGRKAAVQSFLQGMETAKALEAGCIGSETTNRMTQPAATQEEALAALECSLGEILPRAEELGVIVGIEPVYYHTMATPELTRRVLEDMQSPNLRVIFDAVNLISPEDMPQDRQDAMLQRAAEHFGDKIAAVHIKGACLQNGEIAAAGLAESQVRIENVFAMLRGLHFNGPVMREMIVPEHAAEDLALMRRWATE